MRHFFLAMTLMLVAALVAAGAKAGTARALLVGVSDYPDGLGMPDLNGPANDVRLLARVLADRGVSEITTLADGVSGAEAPTRAAILAALSDLTTRSGDGDFVFLYFSGHGSQQRDLNGDEPDGRDEIFLPADASRGAPGAGILPGALVDDEIGAAVTALRALGTDVWLVMDFCNAGSATRAGGLRSATRFVSPALLGLTLDYLAEPAQTAPVAEAEETPDLPGRFVAFYAAQSSEEAIEVDLAPMDPETNGWYGLFTAKLAARLESSTTLSYRQLFQAVLSDVNAPGIPGVSARQTPLWDGDLIDATVFGGRETVGLRQFPVTWDAVSAGTVQGLRDNTVVALVNDAAAAPEAVLGFAQVEEAGPLAAYLAPVAADCAATAEAPCARVGALPPDARFARIVAQPQEGTLRLAPPRGADGAALHPDHPLAMALDAAIETLGASAGAPVQIDPVAYTIDVAARDGALWFGRATASGNSPAGLAWRPGGLPLADILQRIAAAEALATTLAAAERVDPFGPSKPVVVEARVLAVPAVALAGAVAPDPQDTPLRVAQAECRRALGRAAAPVALSTTPHVKQCDQIEIRVQGRLAGAERDINRIHIDANFCIKTSYQRLAGTAAPTRIGRPITICSDCPDGAGFAYTAGVERLFVITTEAQPNAEALRLDGLLDNCGTPAATRGAGDRARARDLLDALGQRTGLRSDLGSVGIANVWVDSYSFTVLPRAEAYRQAGLLPSDQSIPERISP